MLTEEQASTKWCPQVRHGDEEGGTFNRGGEPGNAINEGRDRRQWSCACIGSACMMWRWHKHPTSYTSRSPREGWTHIPADEAPDYDMAEEFWLEPDEERLARRLGWCGLAGRVDYA